MLLKPSKYLELDRHVLSVLKVSLLVFVPQIKYEYSAEISQSLAAVNWSNQ
jgi:hypothetical protein